MEARPLTTGEIAQYCHVTDRAVLKWVDEGKLKAYRTPGNHSRISVSDFLQFLKAYNMPIPADFKEAGVGHKILIVDDDKEKFNGMSPMLKQSIISSLISLLNLSNFPKRKDISAV